MRIKATDSEMILAKSWIPLTSEEYFKIRFNCGASILNQSLFSLNHSTSTAITWYTNMPTFQVATPIALMIDGRVRSNDCFEV